MIKAAIADGLKEQYPELAELTGIQGNPPLTEMEMIPLREIDFYVGEGGVATVVFDKYEIAPGVAGMLTVVVGAVNLHMSCIHAPLFCPE